MLLPPVHPLRIYNRIGDATGVSAVLVEVVEFPVPVDPTSGRVGFGIPLGRSLNL